MKLEHEQGMFLAAVRGTSLQKAVPSWCTALYLDNWFVVFPSSSQFKHHACVVVCDSAYSTLLQEHAPSDSVHCMYGVDYHFYKDGADAMEGTGASVALRKQQESGVLR